MSALTSKSHIRYFAFSVLLFVLSGCSSSTDVEAKYHSHFDFAKVKSYSTFERDSFFTDFQNISDSTRNGIEIAIENAMDESGFIYSQYDNADVVVGYYIVSQNAANLSKYNKGVFFCEYCLNGNLDQQDKKWKLVPGSLIIDLINPETKRSVWRSFYPLKITIKDNSHETHSKIEAAVFEMLSKYPRNNKDPT